MVIGLRAQLGEFNLPSITVAGVDVPLLTNTEVRNLGVMFHLRYDSECTGRKYHQSIISLTISQAGKIVTTENFQLSEIHNFVLTGLQ